MVEVGTVDEREAVFDWEIENVFSGQEIQDSYFSPDFDCYDCSWYLQLVPNYIKIQQMEGYLGLFLRSHDLDAPNEVRFSLGIRTANGVTEVLETITGNFYDGGHHGSEKIIDISELFRRRDELLPQDALTWTVTLKVGKEVALKKGIKDVSVQTAVEVDGEEEPPKTTGIKDVSVQTVVEVDGEEEPPKKTGGEKVLQDIVNLWRNGENCDVLLNVGDVEFKAHRTILAARTPVLCAMFEHNTLEKTTGEVTINNCEPAVFEQLLHYIYTGAPRELTAENAVPLYVLADKYLLDEVKVLCSRCMQDTLCLDTFCSTVKLSLVYREDELRKMATDFLSRNMILVKKTVEWQRFLHEHTTWANEIEICAMELMEARSEEEKRTFVH